MIGSYKNMHVKESPHAHQDHRYRTPHRACDPEISGFAGYRAGINYERVLDVAIRNLARVLSGEDPIHIVDRTLGY